jgi:hypothetical protein
VPKFKCLGFVVGDAFSLVFSQNGANLIVTTNVIFLIF